VFFFAKFSTRLLLTVKVDRVILGIVNGAIWIQEDIVDKVCLGICLGFLATGSFGIRQAQDGLVQTGGNKV
jgi:hypoxanthine-guanine phosphoribosyltransferase